jgi:hypothetical protein
MFLTGSKVKGKSGIIIRDSTLNFHASESAKQFLYGFALTIRRGIKRPSLYHIIGLWVNAQCMINGLVNLINNNGIFDGLAGPFISCLAKYIAFFDATTKHEHGASIGKMSVHTVELHVIDDIGLLHLLLHFQLRPAFDHHVPAELSCEDNHGPVEMT